MKIALHHYSLRSRGCLNAKSARRAFDGVLIRVGEKDFGYGCIHPWQELGDEPLDEQIEKLKVGEMTPLIREALVCAKIDADARKEGRNLFDGLQVPLSHATLPMVGDVIDNAVRCGFDRVKLKVGRDWEEESVLIASQMQRYPDLKWRFDFNHTCSIEEVDAFLKPLQLEKIDFIEDAENSCGVTQALDREDQRVIEEYEVLVVKPARQNAWDAFTQVQAAEKKAMVTSYMDHPLGQSYAAYVAGKLLQEFPDVILPCGLITHGLFEQDAFTKMLGVPSPSFRPARGTGLGFDELLEDLAWKIVI